MRKRRVHTRAEKRDSGDGTLSLLHGVPGLSFPAAPTQRKSPEALSKVYSSEPQAGGGQVSDASGEVTAGGCRRWQRESRAHRRAVIATIDQALPVSP